MGLVIEIKIQAKDKSKYSIFIDGEYSFAISADKVLEYKLKSGKEYSVDEIEEIKTEAEKELALQKGLNYISKAIKTKKQVVVYLKGKGFSDKAVYYTIDKLKEYDYINDKEYAKLYLENNRSAGKRLVDYKLMSKGVNKNDISLARNEVNEDFLEMAERLVDKRLRNKEITQENLQKTYRYLIGKGFSHEEALSVIKKYDKE